MAIPFAGKSQDSNLGNWLIYIGSKQLNTKWNLHHEIQYRNYNAGGDLEQLLLRTGLGYKIGEKSNDPLAMYLNDIATIPVNMAGIGGMSLPCGLAAEDNLPVGFQIMSPAMKDDRMYLVGGALEAALLSTWGKPILDFAPKLVGSK